MPTKIEIRTFYNPAMRCFDAYVERVDVAQGRREILLTDENGEPDQWSAAENWHYPPTFRLQEQQAQELFQSLWNAGLRSADGNANEGALAAANRHLGDLSRITHTLVDFVTRPHSIALPPDVGPLQPGQTIPIRE